MSNFPPTPEELWLKRIIIVKKRKNQDFLTAEFPGSLSQLHQVIIKMKLWVVSLKKQKSRESYG